jgi:hypothetical protein
MFIAKLFTIDMLWKQPRCPTINEWVNKMWYLCTMEFYSATKKSEMFSFPDKWIELENINLSEITQTQKPISCMHSVTYGMSIFYMEYRLKQMQKYYETLVIILRGGHSWEGRETKNLNMVDILSVEE